MRHSPPPSLHLPLLPHKTTPHLPRLLMSLLSPPSLLLSRLVLRRFCSPSPKIMSRAGENARSSYAPPRIPASDAPSPTRNDRVSPAVPFSSAKSKVASSILGKGFQDSKRRQSSVALGGVHSEKPFSSDDYETEFPLLGSSTVSNMHKDYGRGSGVSDVGLDQTIMQDASPYLSMNYQSPYWRNCGDVTPSRRSHRNSIDKTRNKSPICRMDGYCRRSDAVEVGLDQTLVKHSSPSSSKNRQSPNWRNRRDVTPSRRNHRNLGDKNRNQSSVSRTDLPFDICIPEDKVTVGMGKETHWTETERTVEFSSKSEVLRPGMVLLKRYLTHDEQVDIVKICRTLGVGPRGFYRPGYRNGPKLCLQMMCLGLNWDPETKYSVKLAGIDGKPPDIPHAFIVLVQRAIKDAQALIKEDSGAEGAESVIPWMSPDICIVNFYSATGRLGLHRDQDESRESIRKGMPIVSFSIGDSAEFLYGEYRDVERAEKVTLESGDVLIFGGESRLVFHGVKSVTPNSAPKRLLDDSKLRTGRLNLTFRKF